MMWAAVAMVSAAATQGIQPASPLESTTAAVSTAIAGSQATIPAIRAAIRTRLTGEAPRGLRSVELNRLYDTSLPAQG
jgi:hypothetical protein